MAAFGNLLDGENEEFQVSDLGASGGAINRFRVKKRSKFGMGEMSSVLDILRVCLSDLQEIISI